MFEKNTNKNKCKKLKQIEEGLELIISICS